MNTIMSSNPVIRRRVVKSQRRRDGLIQYARDNTSQNGEDGIIAKIFEVLPSPSHPRVCVDVGAWNGHHLSNTYSLLVPSDDESQQRWEGVLIEANKERFEELRALHEPLGNTCINAIVSSDQGSNNSLVSILKQKAKHLPMDFDFLSIDVDGSDYWLLHDVWKVGGYRPKVVCIEANPTMPNDLIYIPARSDTIRHGASLAALVELAESHGYLLIETTIYNAFFVQKDLYDKYFRELVSDTSIEALHEITMGTSLYQLYDGTLKLWGCKKLLWHRLAIDEKKIQMLSPERRSFPFAPPQTPPDNVVDMSAYCKSETNSSLEQREKCSDALIAQLKADGFVLVRGTGIPGALCEDALRVTNAFLQEADESVRRSCLTEDRARRGYSPMCTENFASLIGEEGPNDLVRKFRVGPSVNRTGETSSPLLRPNVWPPEDVWDTESSKEFHATIEKYYDGACLAANAVVRAICDGLTRNEADLASSLDPIFMKESIAHTSILTLLGYRKGTRHKKTQKKRVLHPLVAAHTDVGVITVLLFDGGDCAVLQRELRGTKGTDKTWANVVLPSNVPEDPIFVVNIADCLSDLSRGRLPSTLHRVMPSPGTIPRNCLALFVGLDPSESLNLDEGKISYEEWRKKRIAKSQLVLKGKSK